jgi:hypothetical protein
MWSNVYHMTTVICISRYFNMDIPPQPNVTLFKLLNAKKTLAPCYYDVAATNPLIRGLLSINWLPTEYVLIVLVNTKQLKDIKIVSKSIQTPPSPLNWSHNPTSLSYKTGTTDLLVLSKLRPRCSISGPRYLWGLLCPK